MVRISSKAIQHHYREANPVSFIILMGIGGFYMAPTGTCTVPKKWSHVTNASIYSRVISTWCTSEQIIKEKGVHGISAVWTTVFQVKQFLQEDHEMQAFIILLRHRSDSCPLWEELKTTQSSNNSWTWVCHSLLLSIHKLSCGQLNFWGNDLQMRGKMSMKFETAINLWCFCHEQSTHNSLKNCQYERDQYSLQRSLQWKI